MIRFCIVHVMSDYFFGCKLAHFCCILFVYACKRTVELMCASCSQEKREDELLKEKRSQAREV